MQERAFGDLLFGCANNRQSGRTPLYLGAQYGFTTIVGRLVGANACVDEIDNVSSICKSLLIFPLKWSMDSLEDFENVDLHCPISNYTCF